MKLLTIVLFLFKISLCYSQEQFSVFFESNKFDLKANESQKLNSWINDNKEIKIVGVYGFCDEDGSTTFNDTLAQKRVDFVYQIIKNQLKIRDDFKTRSFGEQHQLSKNKADNRKVTLFYILQQDLSRENEILGIKTDEITRKATPNFPDKMIFENPNGTTSEMKLDTVFMNQVNVAKAGEKLKLENLNFQLNTFAILRESKSKLYELLIVLENNPKLKIDIQGHLCCSPVDKTNLSTQRAKAIYNFLVLSKINSNRLSYKGFGSTSPLFPLPEKSEQERMANRRVEILIIENE